MRKHIFPGFASLIFISIMLIAFSCKHEPIDTGLIKPIDTSGTNGIPCSSDTVYFEQQILPLLQSSCALSGCHDAATHKDDVILDSYSNIIATGGIKVKDPTDSKIYEKMVETGEDRMPPLPAAAMTTEQLALIAKWIGQGAKNNSCPDIGCDTTNVKYSTHIKPLIQNTCQGCHSGAAPAGGIDLSTYAGIKAIADNGKFFGTISHLTGYKPMPQNGNKLSDCRINMVKIWINGGALEN